MAKKQDNKKTIIIVAVIILLLFLFMQPKQAPQTYYPNGSAVIPSGNIGSGGGGGSGGQSGGTPDTGGFWDWFSGLGDLFSFNLPDVNFPLGDSGGTTPTDKPTGTSCTSNSQCASGYCNLGNKAVGQCQEPPITPECSKNSDCNYKCAANNVGICNNGKCGCSTSTPTPTSTCTDSDKYLTRDYDSQNYQVQGTCQPNSVSRSVTDYCAHGYLEEYYCRNGDTCAIIEVNCESVYGHDYFCMDGMCVKLL